MIYLALEIIAYLVTALVLGGGAGWLLRNLAAQRREAELIRELGHTRQALEKLQARARGSEERIEALQAQVRDREARVSALLQALQSQEGVLAEKERRIGELEAGARAEAPAAEARGAGHARDDRPGAARDDTQKAGTDPRVRVLEAELARAERALETERRRVAELQRERALQLNTLKALHQQLEMARERDGRGPLGRISGTEHEEGGQRGAAPAPDRNGAEGSARKPDRKSDRDAAGDAATG